MYKEVVIERRDVEEDGFIIKEEFGEEGEVLSEKLKKCKNIGLSRRGN